MRYLRLNFIITLIGFLDTHLLIPVMALYATALGADVLLVGIIVGIYSLSNTIANVVGGRLVDSYGYKRVLVSGLAGDMLAMLAYAFCAVPWQLTIVRFIHGLTGGMVGPSSMSAQAVLSSRSKMTSSMGYYGAAIALATLLGYGGGGVVASRLGYNYVFYIGAILLFISIVLACFLPGRNGAESGVYHRYSLKGLKLLLGEEKLIIAYITVWAQYFAFGGIVALLPLYINVLGLAPYHVGILLACFSVAFILVQILGGRAESYSKQLKFVLAGIALAVAGIALLPLSGILWVMLLMMLLYGVGFGLIFPSISSMVVDVMDSSAHGIRTGIFHALVTTGVAVGAPVMGWIASVTGLKIGISMSCMPLLVALLILIYVLNKRKVRGW